MAKGSRNRNRYRPRDANVSLTGRVRLTAAVPFPSLSSIQDLRSWHPQRSLAKLLDVFGGVASVGPAATRPGARRRSRALLPSAVGFNAPQRAIVCVRRSIRKEVLHAFRKTGKGVRRRRARKSWHSGIRC